MSQANEFNADWRDLLMEGKAPGVLGSRIRLMRRMYGSLPADPRCKVCNVPFAGGGARFARTALRMRPSTFSMQLCNRCERYARGEKPGAEVDLALVFADIRGSTTMAESMSARDYSALIDRFYTASADVLVKAEAIIEKLAGDQIAALFVPGLVDGDHVSRAVEAAVLLMAAYGYGQPDGPWVEVGAGVHTGTAFVGMVGTSGQMTELTSLGDAPNVTARLAGLASSGEILVSAATVAAAESEIPPTVEVKDVSLKGKAEPMRVHVIATGQVDPSLS